MLILIMLLRPKSCKMKHLLVMFLLLLLPTFGAGKEATAHNHSWGHQKRCYRPQLAIHVWGNTSHNYLPQRNKSLPLELRKYAPGRVSKEAL